MASTSSRSILTKRRSLLAEFIVRLLRDKPLGTLGGAIVLVLLIVGILSPVISTHDVNRVEITAWFAPPSMEHFLGTDHLGRDIYSRIIFGARISVVVGLTAAAINVVVAVLIGVLSGYISGKFDLVLQRFVDAWFAFPYLIILLTVMSMVGRGLTQIIVVLGISYGIGNSRVLRSAVISIKENDYFLAAKAIGSPWLFTLAKHILPNIMAPIIIIFTISIGGIILAEASLSFLGFGLPLGTPSWGAMLSWEGRREMETAPQLALYPGLSLAAVVYGVNMFGDAMRDLLDPRLRGTEAH